MQETAVNRIIHLILAQQKSGITEGEQQELDAWANASEANRQFMDRCHDRVQVAASLERVDKVDAEAAWQRLMEKERTVFDYTPVVPIRRRSWTWVAAAITIGVIATAAYLFLDKRGRQAHQDPVIVSQGGDIQPGSNKATLTLGDGRTISLDDAQDGVLAKESGAAVNKQGDALVYNPDGANGRHKGMPVSYHIAATPTGGFYKLTLPDQTIVWLNAESSIRFPTAFTGKERRVEVTGEAYFEVAKDPAKPFIVSTGGTEIKVLGTHFNIRNYADDATIKTTLVEGSVQVSTGGGQAGTSNTKPGTVLQPGQQAAIPISAGANTSSGITVQAVDVESVVAWKNGYFDFKAAGFTDVMKEIRRWYAGIEAIDIKTPVDDRFTAAIPRNVPLSTMLTILQETSKAHFEIKGKTVIVTQ